MKITRLALFSLLLLSQASPTWTTKDDIPPVSYSQKALGTMLAAFAAISIGTSAVNTAKARSNGLALLTGLATAAIAEVTENTFMAITTGIGLDEDRLFIKKWDKTGLCLCISRRLIAIVSSNLIREKSASILSSQTDPENSTLLLNSSRTMTALLFILRHLIDENGLIHSPITYWKKGNKRLRSKPKQVYAYGVGSLL